MSYTVKKKVAWGASVDPDVVSYNVYWAIPPVVLDKVNPLNNPNMQNVGNVVQVDLPLAAMPKIDGNLEIGVASVDDVGNISDIVSGVFPFDFQPPQPPGTPYLI